MRYDVCMLIWRAQILQVCPGCPWRHAISCSVSGDLGFLLHFLVHSLLRVSSQGACKLHEYFLIFKSKQRLLQACWRKFRNKVGDFFTSASKYRGYVNGGVAWTHRFWVLLVLAFSLFNNSSNQKSHNVDDDGLAFFDSNNCWIKKRRKEEAPRIDEFKLLHDSHNHDTSTWTNKMHELYSIQRLQHGTIS